MSMIVSVYSKISFMEQILPSLNNTDYYITVRKTDFHLERDIRLRFEILDDVWKIRSSDTYRIVHIAGLHMVFLGDRLAVDSSNPRTMVNLQPINEVSLYSLGGRSPSGHPRGTGGKALYHRAPRPFEKIETQPIQIEEPPGLQKQKAQSMISVIGP